PGGPADQIDGMMPAWVVRPGTVAEVQAVARAGGHIVPCGLGGHLDIGAPPRSLDALVRLGRPDRVTDPPAGGLRVTGDAGCPCPALQDALAAAGQWLPLDPPRPTQTTIGGLVAANLSGPLRASQGTVRDLLLGLEVVQASGALVRGGGRVVKNVA